MVIVTLENAKIGGLYRNHINGRKVVVRLEKVTPILYSCGPLQGTPMTSSRVEVTNLKSGKRLQYTLNNDKPMVESHIGDMW